MKSARSKVRRHSESPTMLPAMLRPCCKGRLLAKLGGAFSVSALLYICVSLQFGNNSPINNARQLRDTDYFLTGEDSRNFRVRGLNGMDESLSVNFHHLSKNFVISNSGDVRRDNLTAYFNLRLQREVLAMKNGLALHRHEFLGFPCAQTKSYGGKGSLSKLRITLIYSVVGVTSVADAVLFLRNNFEKLPTDVVDDIIITLENEAEDDYKEEIENLVDLCNVCRTFFFTGTMWEHRNAAAKFARGDVLVFADARIQPTTDGWVLSLVHAIESSPKLIVSPHVRLRGGEKGRDFSVGFAKNEITWSLAVARGPISANEISEAVRSSTMGRNKNNSDDGGGSVVVAQTMITKEVFAVHKSFFQYLGGFDLEKASTGGEHVLFSLKALTCGGNIALCLCSEVTLEIASLVPPKPTYLRPLKDYEKNLPLSRQKRLLETLHIVTEEEYLAKQTVQMVDFQNPSFLGRVYAPTIFFNAGQDIWLDSFSKRYSGCTVQARMYGYRRQSSHKPTPAPDRRGFGRRNYGSFNRIASRPEPALGVRVRQFVNARKCATRNFRSLMINRQARMVSPTRRTTFYGYIRSADGLYAFGLSPAMSEEDIRGLTSGRRIMPVAKSGKVAAPGKSALGSAHGDSNKMNIDPEVESKLTIVLTRNSSEWIGPFSYTNGAFIYQQSLCLTLLPNKQLTFSKCLKGTKEQIFIFNSNAITQAGVTDSWACAKLPRSDEETGWSVESVSAPVFFGRCLDDGKMSTFGQFKMDVRFKEHCVT